MTTRHKKESTRPIAIDLFSGVGGLSLGFEQAGFDIVAAVEVDPIHALTHKYNFPDCAMIPESIIKVSASQIRDAASLGDKEVDVVFGGPPCQGFSLIGQRAMDDPRNTLVRDFVRIIGEVSPTYFLFENVKGLVIGKQRQILHELTEEFDAQGYTVLLPWQVLNAVNYAVPQDRERLFLLGARKGAPLPAYPVPRTIPPSKNGTIQILPTAPTCEEALGDLPDAESFEELNSDEWVVTDSWGDPSGFAKEMRCLCEQAWHYSYKRMWDRRMLTSSSRTRHTEISRRRFAHTRPGEVEPISRFYKLAPKGVSNTLRAGTDSARGAFTSPRPIHYKRNRCITVREMARLHGFPDWFRFHRTKWHGGRQVGNAVPPPLARALAETFIEALGARPSVPEKILKLGDSTILGLDMSSAAACWGVDVPIAKRNKKSGLKKRRQEDIEAEMAALRSVREHG